MVRRSPWLDERARLLARILTEKHGITVDGEAMDALRADISDRLDHVAELMRISRRAAKVYVTDEAIDEQANRIATEVRRQQARPWRNHLRPVD